jgi:hypothetical protein
VGGAILCRVSKPFRDDTKAKGGKEAKPVHNWGKSIPDR